jgi:hypothetical protein
MSLRTIVRNAFALLVAASGAFALSFSLDLLLGKFAGVYSSTAHVPTVTWGLTGAGAIWAAWKIVQGWRWIALPSAVIGVTALAGAIVGRHPQNYGVAAGELLLSFMLYRSATVHSASIPARVHHNVGNIRAKFDYIVLKPAWCLLLLEAGFYALQGSWLTATILLALAFSIGFVGAALHPDVPFHSLVRGVPTLRDAHSEGPGADHHDYRAVVMACFGLSFLLGIAGSVLSVRADAGWGVSLLVGLGIWWFGAAITATLFGALLRMYASGRLRSVAIGLVAFWLTIGAIVMGLGFLIRVA